MRTVKSFGNSSPSTFFDTSSTPTRTQLKSKRPRKQGAVGSLKNELSKLDDDKTVVNVYYPNPERAFPKEPFALFFFQTCLRLLMEKKIGINEMTLLLYLVNGLNGENMLVMFSKTRIAADLNVSRSVVSRSWRKLMDMNILFICDGHLHVNPHLITRSGLAKIRNSDAYLLDQEARLNRSDFPLALGF